MIQDKSVLGVICARGGSKGVPKKNIVPIGGKPLIKWTIDAAISSRYIDRLILSSDDLEIIEVARAAGCEIPFRRHPDLSDDNSSSIDVVLDAIDHIPGYDIVILLQPTSPLRLTSDIDSSLDLLVRQNAPACVSVRPANDHPYLVFGSNPDGTLQYYAQPKLGQSLRRQDLPSAWCLNGAIFAARTDWFLLERTFISPQTVSYRMPFERSIDIDTQDDIEKCRLLVQ